MPILTTSEQLVHKLETTAGVANANMHLVPQNVRLREIGFSTEAAKDDDSSRVATGDLAGNDESIIGMKTGTASYSVKIAPGEYTPIQAGAVDTVSVTDGGDTTGIADGTYTIVQGTDFTTSGAGLNLVLDATVAADVLTAVSITGGGNSYEAADTLTVTQINSIAMTSDATVTVDTVIPTDAGHKLNYDTYFANAGLNLIAINSGVTDDTPATYGFYPSADKASQTATIADIVRNSDNDQSSVRTLAGCIANFTLAADGVGAPFTAAFEAQGRVESVVDVPTDDVVGYDDADIMRTTADNFLDTDVTITDLSTNVVTSFCLSTLSMASGNEVQMNECQSDESGVLNYFISLMNPTIDINPLLTSISDYNYWDALITEKFYRIEIESEFLKTVIPRGQMLSSAIADDSGKMRNAMQFRALRNIDEYVPTELISAPPAKPAEAMYYIIITETEANY
jgi:hypothetical protein